MNKVSNLVFYTQSTITAISGHNNQQVSILVFYTQSTITAISGHNNEQGK